MAPLPSNNTDCWFLDYQVATTTHTMLVRAVPGTTNAQASTAIDALLTELANTHYLMTVIGLRQRPAGSSITNPATWTGASTFGTGTAPKASAANFWDFIGRSHLGSRARLSVFGAKATVYGDDYRINPGESAEATAALAVLVASTQFFIAIDGTKPTFYPYVNVGENAYWRNHIR